MGDGEAARHLRRAAPKTRSGFALLGVAVVLCVGAMAIVGGTSGAVAAALGVIPGGAAILGLAQVVIRGRPRIGTIGLQFAAITAGSTMAGAIAIWLVTVLHDGPSGDRALLAALLLASAALATWAAYMLGMAIGDDVDLVSDGLAAVGAGDRTVHLDVGGGDQVARLAAAGNRMIDQLMLRETERDEAQANRDALVRAMVDQLRDRAAERDRAEEQRRHLFVGVSHDLRTPLTGLQLLANAIRDELSPQQRAGHAEQMLAQIASLTRLTEQVFELSRLEAGDVSWTLVHMPVDVLVRDTVEEMRAVAEARGVALVFEALADLPPAELAPERIARVLANLVQNALEHTPAGGEVRIGVRAEGGAVEVEVADTGTGIREEDRPHVFEPFYRGGAGAARGGPGTGLGLAISRAIVEAHGGRMWLGDADRGLSVVFALPLRPGGAT